MCGRNSEPSYAFSFSHVLKHEDLYESARTSESFFWTHWGGGTSFFNSECVFEKVHTKMY